MNNVKIKEITVSRSGVIPVAAYANLRPGYSMTVEPENGATAEEIIQQCDEFLIRMFDMAANRALADDLGKTYAKLHWYHRGGLTFPSVTSVLGWNVDLAKQANMTPDEMYQYASRGHIVEWMINCYLKDGEWLDPRSKPTMAENVSVVDSGSRRLTWDACTHKIFMEKFEGKLKVEAIQKEVYNDEYLYAGTTDILGEYDGKRSIIDIKCRKGGWDFRQLAAYAMCEEGIEQLVVFPVGETDNKCGYKNPVICDTIKREFEGFIKARALFKRRFGI